MDEVFKRGLHASWERSREARQLAEQGKQRAARLVLQASVLMQRFDELEEKAHLKIATLQGRQSDAAKLLTFQ